MFEVLVYLYENYGALHACPDADSLTKRLTAAGFDDEEITEALAWLSGLEQVTQESIAVGPESERAFRVYAKIEVDRLGTKAIGFLSFLEQAGQLTPTQREIVIERALACDESPIALSKLKIIVLMVFWSLGEEPDALILDELRRRFMTFLDRPLAVRDLRLYLNHCADAEERAVRQRGDQAGDHQRFEARGQRTGRIANGEDHHQQQRIYNQQFHSSTRYQKDHPSPQHLQQLVW